jgi:hypothetical protein
MRSRLEASFAAALDSSGFTWRYEPNCFADETGQYLPDFVMVNGNYLDYIEIKPPTADFASALRLMHTIRSSEPEANLYVATPTGTYPRQGWVIPARCVAVDEYDLCALCRAKKDTP